MKLTPLRSLAIGATVLVMAVAAPSCAEYQQSRPPAPAPYDPNPTTDPYASLPQKPARTSDYPLATSIQGTRDQVISPYKPYNVIDVKGFRTGQLARDPSTAPIDPATGKPDLNQAKIFEIP